MHRSLTRHKANLLRSIPSNTIPTSQKINFSTQSPKMTLFFPRVQQTSPFFQLLNEIDHASRPSRCQPRHRHQQQHRSFTPSFDVKETESSYQLYGELPGIAQSDINIEWADDKTITISGRSERKYQSTNFESAASPAPAVVEAKASSDAASTTREEDFEEITNDQASYQKPSVEDEAGDDQASATASPAPADAAEKSQEQEAATPAAEAPQKPKHKYWISERSTGSFQRTFQFPIRVEHDEVKASLNNGILSVTIPKAKPLEPRKITIN